MKCVSIGFVREDGDFAVLATVNNRDDLMPEEDFHRLIRENVAMLRENTGNDIGVVERQDAPDYVTLDAVEQVHYR